MLQPKKTKFRRQQKGRQKGNAQRGNQLAFGSFGIKALETKWITGRQIEAARMADKLVEEQLKIVQQIAGLLGETAADTKVAVEKLKNTILLESEEENEKK